MSIVHEAVCDGCGKRKPARYPDGSGPLYWAMSEHPEGWFLLVIAGSPHHVQPITQGYCSRRCVALGEVGG